MGFPQARGGGDADAVQFSNNYSISRGSRKEGNNKSKLQAPASTTIIFDDDGRVLPLGKCAGANRNIRRSVSDHSNIPLLSHRGKISSASNNLQRNNWDSPTNSSQDHFRYFSNNSEIVGNAEVLNRFPGGKGKQIGKPVKSATTLPKIKKPVLPLSETRGSYQRSISERRSNSTFPYREKGEASAKSVPEAVHSLSSRYASSQKRKFGGNGGQRIRNNSFVVNSSETQKKKNASDKMRTARSELSLLEQKRLQWAKEREELNGLWSPWGRQSENIMSGRLSPSLQMQASYPSPTNVVSSSYVTNLGIGTPTYSSHSECYLPPINSTIAQQPRQKAKVWNAEFQTEDYRYESDNLSTSSSQHPQQQQHLHTNNHSHRTSRGQLSSRKASLPNYMYESGGESYNHFNNNTNFSHQQMILHQHNKLNNNNGEHNNMWSSNSMDDEAFTSGYYSSENNNNVDDGRALSSSSKDIVLKPTSRERSYQEELTVQKAISIKGKGECSDDGRQSPRVIVHKIYSQNGEVFAEHDNSQEYVVNSMVMSSNTGGRSNRSNSECLGGSQTHRVHESRHPPGNLPRNHAMRSSLTIGVDATNMDAYYESDRRKKEQWLNELEKQREEQRLRKMMEKEERRPRWGDRGIGVGHFWEPAESENSHLPAPPYSSRSKSTGRSESVGNNMETVSGRGGESYAQPPYHPGQSNTPPAWLERSLTRMQSSKSQPSLHDPNCMNDFEHSSDTNRKRTQNDGEASYNPSRSLNQSTIDLRKVAGYCSPTGDSDRTFLRGQNVPVDPDTYSERERKRLANQEHLEALKKQIEERQQKQKEEMERRLQEEREQEMRIARQREIELQRLEMEKRGKMPVNGDMPNCVEEATDASKADLILESATNTKPTKISTMVERASQPVHDASEEKDIEIVQRQSAMVVTEPLEDDKPEANVEPSRPRLSRQDQCVMTDSNCSDVIYERTLTPSIQRSRSLSLCRSSREFGTQTELSDGSSTSSGSGSTCGSGKNSEKTRSHNSLLDKKQKEKMKQEQQLMKKSEERPRWGSNPIKKQYIKQSEKDPNYISRMRRRQERLKRMEEERSARGDTGTESEDVSIPFHRIRQRRNNSEAGVSPRRVKPGITPMKAIVPLHTQTEADCEKQEHERKPISHSVTTNNKNSKTCRISPPNGNTPRESGGMPKNVTPCPHSHSIKNAKSETHLNKAHQNSSAEIIDRNFGSVAGINTMGTSEESSGFSTPFLPKRDLGSGSTGSGTTGSGSGVQSPDLAYHTYQAEKSTKEERKYAQITSGRDTHMVAKTVTGSNATISGGTKDNSGNTITRSRREFKSPLKGFIHQEDFDEMPVKSMKSSSSAFSLQDVVTESDRDRDQEHQKKDNYKNNQSSSDDTPVSRGRRTSPRGKVQRNNKSVSPRRKPSPTKVNNKKNTVSVDNPKGKSVERPRKSSKNTSNNVDEDKTEKNVLPDISPPQNRPTSPPVPALLKKMQMGLQPDESGRISSLPTEFPDILAPLPAIPLQLLSPSRISSATSGASSSAPGKIDIDIAVTRRNSPGVIRLLEAADERLKQRQLSAIMNDSNNNNGNDGIYDEEHFTSRSRNSFEGDVGRISINLEPLMYYNPNNAAGNNHIDHINNGGGGRSENREFEMPVNSARLSIRSHSISPRPPPTSDAARHEAFIASILNSKEVKEQLSARESELSEKGIIEFSIKLPSTSSGDDFVEEYRDPLLTERRRHTAQWLYGSQGGTVPQKQAILTNLSTLKKGLSLQQQDWIMGHSDTD